MDNYVTSVGFLAAILTTSSFVPQIIRILNKKNTIGLSISMYLFLSSGCFFWILHGVNNKDFPLVISNGFTFLFSLLIVFMIYKK